MNKLLTLFIVFLLSNVAMSQNMGLVLIDVKQNKWETNSRLEIGYPHAGSYSKERASFAFEQEIGYYVGGGFFVGAGTGFALYPAAYTIPAHLILGYNFSLFGQRFYWMHRIGVNTKFDSNSFFNYRYNSNLRYKFETNKKVRPFVGLGGNYIWDTWGGKSLSGTLDAGVSFSF